MQIDDTIMQKNLSARLALADKKVFFIYTIRGLRWPNIFNWKS